MADPEEYENLFPGLNEAIKAEKYMEQNHVSKPAAAYTSVVVRINYNSVLKLSRVTLIKLNVTRDIRSINSS